MTSKKTSKKKSRGIIEYDFSKPIALTSGITQGLLRTEKKEFIASLVATPFDYIQAALKCEVKRKFIYDIHQLYEKGKLPEDFLDDDLSRKTYLDISKIIDSENPSVDKVDAMLALLVAVADVTDKSRYQISTHLDTLKELDSVEFNIVNVCYEMVKSGSDSERSPHTKDAWRTNVLAKMKWESSMMYEVERREEHLINLRLIDSHPGQDLNALPQSTNCRLTGLAIRIGDILALKKEPASS